MLDLAPGAAPPLWDDAGPGAGGGDRDGGGTADWERTRDGLRLRVAAWGPDAPRGTVLVFTGRGEYVEKYARVAAVLGRAGFATASCDWRGQGLSERVGAERLHGHVRRFTDYQRDVAALVAWGRRRGLPRPWFLLAHSMGGAVGLRALAEGLPVAAAAFSAPMWGLSMAALRPAAALPPNLPFLGAEPPAAPERPRLRLRDLMAGRRSAEPYLLRCDFAGNMLTSDRETFDWLRAQLTQHPELAVGVPTLHWMNEALREMARLAWLPPPPVPTLALLGTEEMVVDPGRIRRRIAAWPAARLVVLAGARHEPLMENPTLRDRALDEVIGHFAEAGASAAPGPRRAAG